MGTTALAFLPPSCPRICNVSTRWSFISKLAGATLALRWLCLGLVLLTRSGKSCFISKKGFLPLLPLPRPHGVPSPSFKTQLKWCLNALAFPSITLRHCHLNSHRMSCSHLSSRRTLPGAQIELLVCPCL